MPDWKGIVGTGFTRDEFANYIASIHLGAWRPQFVVLHNTAVPKLADWHKVSGEQRMKNLESYYKDTQRWSAGPHLFVADDRIWVFTPLTTPGVHSPSWNAISWGVELVGDYETEKFTAPLKDNAIRALALLHQLGGRDPRTLRLHKEDPNTTHKGCPGKAIMKQEIIDAIEADLAALHPGEHAIGAAGG